MDALDVLVESASQGVVEAVSVWSMPMLIGIRTKHPL
jgi:hypothetical protein